MNLLDVRRRLSSMPHTLTPTALWISPESHEWRSPASGENMSNII